MRETLTDSIRGSVMKRLVVSVSGMDCASCAPIIRKRLTKVRGVKDVRAAVMLNRVMIDYDPEEADQAEINLAVEEVGFKALTMEERR